MSALAQVKGMDKLIRKLRATPAQVKKVGDDLVKKHTRALISSSGKNLGLVQMIPPASLDRKITGREARDAGEAAIRRDLLGFGSGDQRTAGVFIVIDDATLKKNAHVVQSQPTIIGGIYGRVQKIMGKIPPGSVRLFIKKNGIIYGTDQRFYRPNASIAEMAAVHKTMRRKDGRVTRAATKTRDIGRWRFIQQMVVGKKAFNRYYKHVKKHVGMLAASVVLAYNGRYGPLRGVPAWISRHGKSWASFSLVEKNRKAGLTTKLTVRAGEKDAVLRRLFAYAQDFRLRAMQREAPHALRGYMKSLKL